MLAPKKVKKSQRPRFRGKGLLTEGYFSQFEPIHIPPQFNYARLLLKETLIPNPINNTIEVSGHFAVSATTNNMSKLYFRPWVVNQFGGYAPLVNAGLFDQRMVDLTARGSFGFLSFNFPDQSNHDRQYIDLPIPDKYVAGLTDIQMERLATEKMMIFSRTSNLKENQYLDLMKAPVFISTSATSTNYDAGGTTGIRVSPYESYPNADSPVSLSTEPMGNHNGERLVLNFGSKQYTAAGDHGLQPYDVIPHLRLSLNNSERTGFPYLQFFRYRYTILLRQPENDENVFEFIQNRYVNNVPPDDDILWQQPVKTLIFPRNNLTQRKDGFDNVNLYRLLENHMAHLNEDNILYEGFFNDDELRSRTEFLSFKITPRWQYKSLPDIVIKSEARNGIPWYFSNGSWHTFSDGQNIYDWIKSKIPSVDWTNSAAVRKFKEEYEVGNLKLEYRISNQEATTIWRYFQTEKDWESTKVTNRYVGDSPRNYEDPNNLRPKLFYMYMYIRGREGSPYGGSRRISASEYPSGGGMSKFVNDWITIVPRRYQSAVPIVRILYNYTIRDNNLQLPINNMSRVDAAKYLIDNYHIDDIRINCAYIVIEDDRETTGESYDHTGVNLISALMEIAQQEDEAGN